MRKLRMDVAGHYGRCERMGSASASYGVTGFV